MTLFEVSASDIEQLKDFDLTDLLRRLLLLEASRIGLAQNYVDVSLNIDVPDGGEDGKVEWVGEPDPTKSNWLPRRCTLFQVKATAMGPEKCRTEVLNSDETAIKPRVYEVVKAQGAYVLFYGKMCGGQSATARKDKILEAFKSCV